jgi:tetratricopeptide (TPR) repeat protein
MGTVIPCVVPLNIRACLRVGVRVLAAFALPIPAGIAQPSPALPSCNSPPAKAVSVQGTVEARRGATTQWQPVKLNDAFCAGDAIRVGDKSRADVALLNQSVLRINANSAFTVEAPKEERTGVIALVQGAAHFFARGPRSLEVRTPFTIAGVRGTEFYIELDPDKALMTVFEGTVVAQSSAGNLSLSDGQSAVAASGKAPVLTVVARPRDAVQWALYYPPVLYFRPDEFPAGSDWQGTIRRSSDAYSSGDLRRAFEILQTAPRDANDPRFYAYRAHLLLAVGQVDDARADISRALQSAPNDANAWALQSIIAVAQGDKQAARDAAERSVAAAPNSATPHIAMSYAQQAAFDLAGARASLQKAVELDAQNALAWARLAEIESSFGESERSLSAARKATELQPNLSRTQAVLGFAYLTQIRTAEAREAFEKAITLDQGDPLPRLGLGLAKIRDGDLDEGGRDIEVAASLDSSNAIVRSYLGKTYYEEKLSPRDEREYAVAKQLDPNDPTPFFYDAIAKQTTNRPVEALYDIEKAIELNDNRAIYRSRLLLDADLAARSASLARIYTDLGFQQLALVEGWKSVNTDPGNFSAHRFLADTYAVLPRHEIARVSELLQSQLLQPLSMTPIQPHLAESNLFLLSASGPSVLSFNEFNPLFTRNGATVQASGIVGSNDTSGIEGVVSGIYRNMAFSLGGFHFESDGWRQNADQKDDIANAFVQFELSPQTSIQAEYRYRKAETGDLQLRFFPEEFFPGQRTPQEVNTYRLGARHSWSPNALSLASLTYSEAKFGAFDTEGAFIAPGFITFVGLKEPQKAVGAELQQQYRAPLFNIVGGIGYFDRDSTSTVTTHTILEPPDDVQQFPTTDTSVKHTNVYAYSYLNFLRNATLTLGASGDFLEGESADVKGIRQFNPKLGVTWEPRAGTTLRAAAFRVVKRTLITNQTLEPTQVAGFNQFFDDFNGTKAWRYGAAVDQKFAGHVFGGVEVSRRALDVPAIDQFGDAIRVDWKENLARGYVFWTPHPWFALRGGVNYEQVRRDEQLTDGVKKLNTWRVPIGVNFFHPSGISAALAVTYHNQDGEFESIRTGEMQTGRETFWTVDAGLSYRLPRRNGFVSVGVANLFNKEFRYFDTDFRNPSILPDRVFRLQATLALP